MFQHGHLATELLDRNTGCMQDAAQATAYRSMVCSATSGFMKCLSMSTTQVWTWVSALLLCIRYGSDKVLLNHLTLHCET